MTKRDVLASTPAPTPVQLSSGKWTTEPTVTVICSDCGAERIIKTSDAFQVKRCIACQDALQRERRNERTRARNAAKSAERRAAEVRELLLSLTDEELAAIRNQG